MKDLEITSMKIDMASKELQAKLYGLSRTPDIADGAGDGK
jgi:hypothetical protein